MPGSPTDPGAPPVTVAVTRSDYLWFVDRALDEMMGIVDDLGDEAANRRPPLAGANAPFAILTHCLGVMEYWGGATVAGRPVRRDRNAEFVAQGAVADLRTRVDQARRQFRADVDGADGTAVPSQVVRDPADPVPYSERTAAVLLHVLEELYQHLGQMELSRDLLRASP